MLLGRCYKQEGGAISPRSRHGTDDPAIDCPSPPLWLFIDAF
jgi:hypothetical protein